VGWRRCYQKIRCPQGSLCSSVIFCHKHFSEIFLGSKLPLPWFFILGGREEYLSRLRRIFCLYHFIWSAKCISFRNMVAVSMWKSRVLNMRKERWGTIPDDHPEYFLLPRRSNQQLVLIFVSKKLFYRVMLRSSFKLIVSRRFYSGECVTFPSHSLSDLLLPPD